MASIDERIVQMTFKSAEFLTASEKVLTALQNLKAKLTGLKGAEGAINDIDAAGKKLNLSSIASGVDQIASKFSAMGVIAVSALASIASKAVMAGAQLLKSLTLDPVLAGLDIYSTKINAIQTILANTMGQQGSNIQGVTAALDELNQYSNLTIYRFGDMAKNIGLFTAAGVGIKDSVSSIKGLANIAALSGASTNQAASAMYQMSQAIASGTVRLMDWNSVVNAGMGGKVFQNALIQTARVHGVAVDDMIKKNGSFRDSLQEGWLTSDIMTETLATFTGDLSAAQLKAMGYTDAQTKAIMEQAKMAVNAATKVRTVSQLWDVMGDSIATAWSKVWEALLGNMDEATTLLTGVSGALSNIFVAPIQHLGEFLNAWKDLGGRTVLISALTKAFQLFGDILKPIKDAFREVFPPATAQQLYELTLRFYDFISGLKLSGQAADNLHRIFTGIFSAIKIVWDVIKGVIGVIGDLIGAITGASGGFLGLGAKAGDLVTNFKNMIESGGALNKFFDILSTVLTAPVKLLGLLGEGLDALAAKIGPVVSKIADEFKRIGSAIFEAFKSGDLSNVANLINQGLLGAILLAIRSFIKNLTRETKVGLLGSIKASFSGLTNALKSMQANLNASTLEKIAIAVALLAASLVALSFIDAGKLVKSLTAITVMFTELMGAMAIISKLSSGGGFAKMAIISASLIALSTAILILAGAVALLSMFSWEQLAKGIGAIAVMLGVLVAAVNLMPTKNMLAAAVAMDAIAVAIDILTAAVVVLGHMDLAVLAKGLGAIAAGMVIIAGAMRLMPKNMALQAAGLLVVSTALLVLSGALKILGTMSWGSIGKSLTELAGALVILSAALILMTGTLAGSAALLVAAGALAILTPILVTLGAMPWSVLLTSLGALAAVFVVLGAAGLLLAPVAPALLAIGAAMILFGAGVLALGLGVTLLATGLTVLGAALTVSGAAIISFVTSILNLIPLAMQKIGEGIVQLAGAIAQGGAAITAAFVTILSALLDAIVKVMPKIEAAMRAILDMLLRLFIEYVPKAAAAFMQVLLAVLTTIDNNIGKFVDKGMSIIVNFLNGIARKIPDVVTAATNIIIAFVKSIGDNSSRVVQAAIDTIVKFLNTLATQLSTGIPRIMAAAANVGRSLVQGVINGITGMIPGLNGALGTIGNLLSRAWNWLTGSPSPYTIPVGKSLIEGVAVGIEKNTKTATDAAEETGRVLVRTLSGLEGSVELRPVVTPVIDLSEARRGFDDLAAMSRVQPVTTAAMAAVAVPVQGTTPAGEAVPAIAGSVYNFTQNNTSPKALSEADIYRQTNNLLSVLKGGLP